MMDPITPMKVFRKPRTKEEEAELNRMLNHANTDMRREELKHIETTNGTKKVVKRLTNKEFLK